MLTFTYIKLSAHACLFVHIVNFSEQKKMIFHVTDFAWKENHEWIFYFFIFALQGVSTLFIIFLYEQKAIKSFYFDSFIFQNRIKFQSIKYALLWRLSSSLIIEHHNISRVKSLSQSLIHLRTWMKTRKYEHWINGTIEMNGKIWRY